MDEKKNHSNRDVWKIECARSPGLSAVVPLSVGAAAAAEGSVDRRQWRKGEGGGESSIHTVLALSHFRHLAPFLPPSVSVVFLSSWPPPSIVADGTAVGLVPLARQYRGRAHARRTCFAHPFRPRRILRYRRRRRRRRDSQTCVAVTAGSVARSSFPRCRPDDAAADRPAMMAPWCRTWWCAAALVQLVIGE